MMQYWNYILYNTPICKKNVCNANFVKVLRLTIVKIKIQLKVVSDSISECQIILGERASRPLKGFCFAHQDSTPSSSCVMASEMVNHN